MIAERPIAKRIRTKADIVFCVDATGSMRPCIDGVKQGLKDFAEELQSRAAVNFRLRLIAYRDLHDPKSTIAWDEFDFTSDLAQFRSQLDRIDTEDTQEHRGAESTLDAIYRAIQSDWRELKTHKAIVVLTDDNTHETLHPSTYGGVDNDVNRVIQEFREMRSSMLFMVAPKYPLYEKIERDAKAGGREVIARWVPVGEERYIGLRTIDWTAIMAMLGGLVSAASIEANEEEKEDEEE